MSKTIFEPWIDRLLAWLEKSGLDLGTVLEEKPPTGGSILQPISRDARPLKEKHGSWEPAPGFNDLALELFALQFRLVEPYRRYCEHLGLMPNRVPKWSAIPCLPTAGFKEFDLTSLPQNERTTVFHSSGTTRQQPGRHYHSQTSLRLYETSLLPWFKHHLLPDRPNMRILSLVPSAIDAPCSSLAYMVSTVLQRLGSPQSRHAGHLTNQGTWELDLDAILDELNSACAESSPLLIAGTAFGFVHLLDALNQRRQSLALPPGSRLMETGGYKGRSRSLPKARLHAALTRTLGIAATHIVSEYGMSELSSQAYDRQVGDTAIPHFRFPPWCATRVVSPETGLEAAPGQTGLLQVIDLANTFSVLAVQTEDLVIKHQDGFDYVGRARAAAPRGCSLMHA